MHAAKKSRLNMRIALLGIDNVSLAVAAAAAGGRHEIVLIDGQAARAKEAAAIAPRAKTFSEWETLLSGEGIEAIVVAADEPALRVEQLKRLIQLQRGIAVLVSHPLSLSMLESYELEMIREESASVVMPYLPARFHPAVEELETLVDQAGESTIGAVEQITFQRSLAERDRDSVLRQFARDVDLLQVLAGKTVKMHAFASGTGPGMAAGANSGQGMGKPVAVSDLRNLVVQMTTDRGLICRWTVMPTNEQAGATLTLVGSQGEANLRIADDKRPWRLEVRSTGEATTREFPGWDPAATALDQLNQAHTTPGEVPPSWAEGARTVELAETIDRSLARGRTIELHDEEFSDIGTFKGTMTSVGCGLLVAGLMLVVVVALVHLVAVQAGWNQLAAQLDNWPYLLLAVCGIYLLLQPLVFIGKPRKGSARPADIDDGSHTD